jgi:protein SCO1/2
MAAAAFLAGVAALMAAFPDLRERLIGQPSVGTSGSALVGGPFTLTDHKGRTVTEKDFLGRYMLVFFGFTNCPDICPTGLQVVSAALDQLGTKAEQIVPVLITVDPERDTSEVLAEYVKAFHPNMVGLTGSLENIQAVAKAYRVYFKKAQSGTDPKDYTMDHTSIIYLMGRDGKFITHFTHATPVDALVTRLAKLN